MGYHENNRVSALEMARDALTRAPLSSKTGFGFRGAQMHTTQKIEDAARSAGYKKDTLQSTRRGAIRSAAYVGNEVLGRLYGATLAERVVSFLEQSNRAAYGLP